MFTKLLTFELHMSKFGSLLLTQAASPRFKHFCSLRRSARQRHLSSLSWEGEVQPCPIQAPFRPSNIRLKNIPGCGLLVVLSKSISICIRILVYRLGQSIVRHLRTAGFLTDEPKLSIRILSQDKPSHHHHTRVVPSDTQAPFPHPRSTHRPPYSSRLSANTPFAAFD